MRKNANKKFNIVYQITNTIDGKIYIGCHQTDDIDDGYMGSGTYLKRAMNKHGGENFNRIILENFDTSDEMFEKEKELANEEFVKRKDTYNIQVGGLKPVGTKGTATVKDKKGNFLQVDINDPRYLSGELVGATTGRITVKDKNGNALMVDKDDPRYLSGEYKYIFYEYKDYFTVKDIFGNYCSILPDEFKKNRQNYMGTWTGKRHNEESKKKIGKITSKAQKGKGNSQYGKCWIYNLILEESKKIKKDELNTWISKGWVKGRKMYFK